MITRPLELSSRLRPPPASFHPVFLVNAALIALFFSLFGSRFVLSPGLGVDFRVPSLAGAGAGAAPTGVVISVRSANMAFVDNGRMDFTQLAGWLRSEASKNPGSRLLVRAHASLSTRDLARIYEMAAEAGFSGVQIAAEGGGP